MKKYIVSSLSVVFLVLMMAAISSVYAADTQAVEKAAPAMAQADAGITVSGTINDANQLIDDKGQAFELSENTEKGLEVKALVGQKVELKGTVMDEAGQSVLEVKEYKIIGSK